MSVQREFVSQRGELAEQTGCQSERQGFFDSENDAEEEQKEGVTKDEHSKTEKTETMLKEPLLAEANADKLRKSSRERRLTPKMLELKEQESAKREKKFKSAYDKWKTLAREVRTKLRHECSETDLYDMMDAVEKLETELKELYNNIRLQMTPSQEIRRKTDACAAVTADLMGLMKVRLTEEGEEFDAEAEKARLCMLLDNEYAKSTYGSSISKAASTSHTSSCSSETPSISAKRAETAAQLAAKKAEIEMEAAIDAQRQQLKRLENQRDIGVIEAKLKVYNEEELKVKSEGSSSQRSEAKCARLLNPYTGYQGQASEHETTLVQTLQESMALTRLPVPEPSVFHGDPIQFTEWSTSFKALIERRCSNPADRLFYLQKYVGGEARSALEGSFYRKDEEAYQQAWDKLDTRYGHSFVVQRAYRDKLNKWPRIGAKEYVKLREFSDFLQTCSDAMPHVKGLQVLNDCEENQKLLVKLPDWVTSRWNRYVTEQLDHAKDYPSFREFASFISKEARIACNPVSSLHALKPSEERTFREMKRPKANTFATNVKASDARHITKAIEFDDKSKDSNKPKKLSTPAHSSNLFKCTCCEGNHSIHKCQILMEKSLEDRRKFVQVRKLCFACLRRGHISKDCRNKAMCGICKRHHPTLLHEDHPPADKSSIQSVPQGGENTSSLLCCITGDVGGSTSMIVPVWISSPNTPEYEIMVYALLDTQSSHTFVDKEVCEKLRALMEPVKLKLSTMMAKDSIVRSWRVSGLKVKGFNSNNFIDLPPAYTRDFIPFERTHIPTRETASKWKHLKVIAPEMPSLMDCEVGLLIGYDCSKALAPREVVTGGDYEPYAVKTDLGWSIVGSTPHKFNSQDVTGLCHRVSVKELPPVSPASVLKALELDFVDTRPGEKSISQEDIQFLQILKGSIQQNECGHLEMPLPFKARPHLPDNKKLALTRLKHLKRRLDRDPKFKVDYVKFMEGIFKDGDAERADKPTEPGHVWYIPHQGVYHPRKPDKIRVVFDCSAKYKGTSLNDHLLTGPDLTNGLTGVLCRFRKHPIAITCDVEKMFHRFHVSKTDRDFLRFLWWDNGNTDSEPREYRMKVHLFGASSSPGCANYGLKHLVSQNESEHPSAANFISKHFYVDDGLISVESVDVAVKLVKEAQMLCAKGKLHLHKFISNNREVLESVCATERAAEVKNVNLIHDDLPMQRVLGVRWNAENDTFGFKVLLDEKPATRRGILSVVASVYDPLGFLAPFLLTGKRILQEMCQGGVTWDEPLPCELEPKWENWVKDIENLDKIQIPRCFIPENFGRVLKVELHHFSDASCQGYGQCSYIRLVGEDKVHCSLVMGKSRVAPTKIVTIPRLELTAAAVSAAVSNVLKEELELRVDREFFWTDSRVVLGYIDSEAKRFHVFIANRVQRIRETTNPEQWFYVDTKENPADHASRGLKVAELISSSWLTGPKFLWEAEVVVTQGTGELLVGDPEVKAIQVLRTEARRHVSFQERLSRFSKWTIAVNAIARIQRLAKKVKQTEPLSVEERRRASLALVRLAQQDTFKEELHILGQKSGKLPPNHKLYQLEPHLEDDIMRVGGRLKRASAPLDLRQPMILPQDSVVTRLILAHHHEKTQHQGRGQTLNELRASGYWIIGGSKAVAQYIRQCVPCRRARRPSEEQQMADLPNDRVDPSPPFTYCGMDCFDPFHTKQGRKVHKRYGLLFTCLCSRAVHVEMLEDMTTDALINGLRCFIAIRGAVRHIRSDQGTNFVGARNEMERALAEMDKDRIAVFLADRQCDFRMNIPSASHVGGIWERQIRTVRSVLGSVLASSCGRLDDASLRTFFYEAMSIINNRPLSLDTITDPKSLEPLTPNHLLTMKSSVPLPPPGKFIKEDVYARKRWRKVQYLSEQFWGRWRKEYLANINLRQKWLTPKRNVKVNDIVIVKEEELPRNEWKLARVLEVHEEDDGLVRRATIQIGERKLGKGGERLSKPSILERPIQKLVVLVESS